MEITNLKHKNKHLSDFNFDLQFQVKLLKGGSANINNNEGQPNNNAFQEDVSIER